MDQKQVRSKIKKFIEERFPNPGQELLETTDLLKAWLVDSLSVVLIVDFLEEKFGVQFQQMDINGENFQTVTSLSNYVMKNLKGS